jgi:S1-C subfamily serine protease
MAVFLLAAPWRGYGDEKAGEALSAGLFNKVRAATVDVLVEDHLNGSGWFVDPQGWLFTAAHMIDGPKSRVEVISPTIGRRAAKVVAVDLGHDLALLRVEPREGGYPALPLAKDVPPAGEAVYLVATPMYQHGVLLQGMMAGDAPTFAYYSPAYVEVVQVAGTVQAGTSGGPWFNRKGEVIGQQAGVMSMNDIPIGVVDMSPVAAVRALWTNKKTTATPMLGAGVDEIWQLDRDFLRHFPPRTEGLVVTALEKHKPAKRAGLKELDLIVAVDEQPVRETGQLVRLVLRKQPGQSVKLTVLRPDGGGRRDITVTLGKLEADWP